MNSVLLSTKHERDPDLTYTRCVATPNGWTFVIPNENSVSYGYLYNNKITTRNDAVEDFCEKFNVSKIYDELVFENYMAKNFIVGERTILQGNAYGFIEPMEATSIGFISIYRQSGFYFKIRNYNYCMINKKKYIQLKI